MGALQAAGMREILSRRQAVEWHLQYNMCPPVPLVCADLAETLLEELDSGDLPDDWWNEEVDHPFKDTMVTKRGVVEGLRLEALVSHGDDEEGGE